VQRRPWITAAAQGIGLASAHAFRAAGADVVATDINAEKLRELEGIKGITPRVLNVLDAAAVDEAIAQIGRIAKPREIADLAVCIAGATYTTGQVHVIDGGWTC
jgi:NAD(P)-dependent dehydrogenase (short-subunit alcohol dehydrogenase family)